MSLFAWHLVLHVLSSFFAAMVFKGFVVGDTFNALWSTVLWFGFFDFEHKICRDALREN